MARFVEPLRHEVGVGEGQHAGHRAALRVEKLLRRPNSFGKMPAVRLCVGKLQEHGSLLWTRLESLPELSRRLIKLALL